MSRLTGTDAYGLMEAYSAVYAPQELTEEQVWEEVETWVNSLLEEGYDLSDYTWEEMYESYLEEQGRARTTGQNSSVFTLPTTPGAGSAGGSGSDGRRGSGRDRNATQTSSSPGALRVKPTAPTPAAPRPAAPAPAAARPAAPAPAAARPAAPAPAARPSGGTPASPKVAPKPTATTTPTPSAPRQKDTSITDMIGRSQVRQGAAVNTGNASSDTRAIAARSSVGATPKPAASAPARPMGGARGRLMSSFDPFDVIKGHLIDEGYADTEESALAIMTNMSEEWRQSILDEGDNYDKNRQRAAKRAAERNAARDAGKTGAVPGVGYVTPRRERETYRDSGGVERHTSGARMPSKDKKDN
jgi:hypothetical protein